MKKFGMYLMMIAMLAMTTTFVACSEDDDNPVAPVITINGGDSIVLDAQNPGTLTIPVTVTSEQDLVRYFAYLIGTDGKTYGVSDTLYSFEDLKSYQTTYTMADMISYLPAGFTTGEILPATFGVEASVLNLSTTQEVPFKITNIVVTHPLSEEQDLTWYRLGNTVTGLDQFGLKWDRNAKDDVYAHIIKDKDGATKFVQLTADNWTNFTTKEEVAGAIEAGTELGTYKGINITKATIESGMNVLGVKYNDVYYIIDLTQVTVEVVPAGSETTITGKYKN